MNPLSPESSEWLKLLALRPRAPLYTHPALAAAAVWIALAVLARTGRAYRRLSWLARAAPAPIALYLAIAVWYGWQPTYYDHVEPSIAASSWRFWNGADLYHDVDAPARTALPYGPALFFLNGAALDLAGPSIGASKLAGISAGILAVLLALWLRPRSAPGSATSLSASLAIACLAFGAMTFWTRGDPLLLLGTTVGLLALVREWRGAPVVIGLAAGLAVDIKFTAGLCFLPLFVAVIRTRGVAWFAVAVLAFATTAAIPFAAFAGISLADHLFWVRAIAGRGSGPQAFATAAEYAAIFVAPVLALAMWRPQAEDVVPAKDPMLDRYVQASYALAVLATIPVAAKIGSGPYQFIPFLPGAVYLYRAAGAIAPRLKVVVLCTAIPLAMLQQTYWIATVAHADAGRAVAEMRQLHTTYAGPMAMGYAQEFRGTFVRPWLVFAGEPYVLDATAVMEHQLAGIPIPDSTLAALASCEVATWLIPHGGTPFMTPGVYDPGRAVFPDELRRAFLDNYARVHEGTVFDAWRCTR